MTTRNSNAHFELAPQVEIERSTLDRSTNVKTSFNVGELIPFYIDEVLPGDTFQIETSKVMRLQTLITPIMDNLYLDTYYFFVPNRLVWDHWKELCGENTTSEWYPDVEYNVPQLRFPPSTGWNVGTIADYMGLPTGVYCDAGTDPDVIGMTVNALPFRAYALICNEWFRDENLSRPLVIPTGEITQNGSNGNGYADVALGGMPYKAAKYHDYFTSCLPAPQKGPDVPFLSGYIPVVPLNNLNLQPSDYPLAGIKISNRSNGSVVGKGYIGHGDANDNLRLHSDTASYDSAPEIVFDNLFANLNKIYEWDRWFYRKNDSALSINSLRQAFQIQRMLEKDARGGTRYIEVLKAHFGVTSPDARLQRPEYLGGNRVPFNIEQVVQNSETTDTSPQGNVAGWSQTNDYSVDVEKSFVEHGFIIGLMVARYDHSYQQGIEPMWLRKGRYDYYWPALAHLGEKAVYHREIYFDGDPEYWDSVFGYQEAWAEYRYKPNYITGEMRSQYAQSLDVWHFADDYSERPMLSESWIKEDKSNVDRTLAVTSAVSNQIFGDIYIKNKCTRPMPLYSIPGLIDHF